MDAIITAATGYTEADLEPFLRSADRACRDVRIFLIVYRCDSARIERLQRKYPFIEPVYVRRKFNRGGKVYRWLARHFIDENYAACGRLWSSVGRYSLNIMLERFFLALEILQARRNSLEKVLLTDSRDVVFQSDPFAAINGSLVSGLEEKTIGECPINSGWIRDVYGRDVHVEMSDRPIVCAGVTLGPAAAVEQYLVSMCSEIWRRLSKVALIAQYDQGIHNYLIHTEKIKLELTDNRAGIIATLHYENPQNIRTNLADGLVVVHGKAPAIVHQYDRHRDLMAFVRDRFEDLEPSRRSQPSV